MTKCVYDVDRRRLRALTRQEHSPKLMVRVHNARAISETAEILKKFDVGIGALPHSISEYVIRSAISAHVNFDLIFGWRSGQAAIDLACKRSGITIIPACGLAPGLTNLLAMKAAEQMERVDEVHIKGGGIPEKPKPPLNYRIVFSFQAVLEEYLRPARIVKGRRTIDVPALSGLEMNSRSP